MDLVPYTRPPQANETMPNTISTTGGQNNTVTRSLASCMTARASAGFDQATRWPSEVGLELILRGMLRGVGMAAMVLLMMTAGIGNLRAAVQTWTNNTSTNNLSNSVGLWQGGVNPVSGDSWVFANTANETLTNNFAANFNVAGIIFNSGTGSNVIGGSAITLSGGITNNSANLQTMNFNIVNSGSNTITASSGNITFGGTITGTGTLSFSGSRTITLATNISYSGMTLSNAGTLTTTGQFYLQGGTGGSVFNNIGTFNSTLAGQFRLNGGSNTVNFLAGTATVNGFNQGSASTSANLITIASNAVFTTTNGGAIGYTGGSNVMVISNGGVFNSTTGFMISQAGDGMFGAITNYGTISNSSAQVRLLAQSGNNTVARLVQGVGGAFYSTGTLFIGGGNPGFGLVSNSTALVQVSSGVFSNGATVLLGGSVNQINNTNTFQIDGGTATVANLVFGATNNFFGTNVSATNNNGTTYTNTSYLTNIGSQTWIAYVQSTYTNTSNTSTFSSAITNIISNNNTVNLLTGGTLVVNGSISSAVAAVGTNSNSIQGYAANGTHTFNWNGGTLRAGGSSATFLTNSSNTTVTVSNNGGIFDINNRSNNIGANMGGTGVLTVTNSAGGAGTLTLSGSNSFGGLIVAAGTVVQGTNNALGATNSTLTLGAGTLNIGTNNNTFGTVNFGNGTLSGTGTFTASTAFNATNSVNLNITNSLAGAGVFTNNSGSATTTLSASNSFNGLTVAGGTLVQSNVFALGSSNGTLTLGAGTLNVGSNNNTFGTVNFGNGTITSSAGGGTLTANTAFNATNSVDVTITNTLLGANATFGKSNNGILTLSGSNSYGGGSTINGGTLRIANSNALGTNFVNLISGTFDLNGFNLTQTGAFTNSGGTLGTNNSTNTLTAATYALQGGTLNAVLGNGAITVSTGTTALGSAGRLNAGSTLNIASGQLSLGGNEGVSSFTNSGGTLGGSGILTAGTYQLNGGTVSANLGSGILNVGASSTLSGNAGASTVNVTNGTLSLNGRLTNGSSLLMVAGGGVALGANQSIGAVTLGNGTISGVFALTNAGVTATNSAAAAISANLTGTGGLAKSGAGTLTLSGLNTYAGPTTINGGTLSVNATNTIISNSSVSLSNLGVFQYTGGNGTLGNNFSVTSGTGIINNTGGGTLTLSGTLDKTGTVLAFNKGNYNVTGKITGTSGTNFNSDLILSNASVTLSTAADYYGPTYLVAGSTLSLGMSNALPTNTYLYIGGSGDGAGVTNALNLGGYDLTIAGLTNQGSGIRQVYNATGNASTLTLAGDSGFGGAISGLMNLTALGARVRLSGANTYTGKTTVTTVGTNGGTIDLGGGGSISGTTNIVVNAGSSFLLGGGGRTNPVNTLATVNLAGTISAGGAGATNRTASQTFSTLTLTGNSVIDFANLGGNSSLTFSSIVMNGYTLSIYNWSGTNLWGAQSPTQKGTYTRLYDLKQSGDQVNLANISFYSGMGTGFLGNGSFSGTEIVPVPEPSAIISALLLLGLLLYSNRNVLRVCFSAKR
jgi:fibronectin-binding autotransporter adhesin